MKRATQWLSRSRNTSQVQLGWWMYFMTEFACGSRFASTTLPFFGPLENTGAFLSTDHRVFNGATWSLALFVRSNYSTHLLCIALLCYACLAHSLCSLAPFTGSLTHFAHSLVGWLKFMNMCSRCEHVSREQTRFLSSEETHP